MRGNIGAVLNRGNNLSELQDRFCFCRNMKKSLHPISKLIVVRSERLNTSSDLFRSEASRLRRNASDLRLRVGLGVGLVVVVVVIIIISTLWKKNFMLLLITSAGRLMQFLSIVQRWIYFTRTTISTNDSTTKYHSMEAAFKSITGLHCICIITNITQQV